MNIDMYMSGNSLVSQIFSSLATSRSWTLTRILSSANSSDLKGELKGNAVFLARPPEHGFSEPSDLVYHEEGDMAGAGPGMTGMRWSRKYVWRRSFTTTDTTSSSSSTDSHDGGGSEVLSVWFAKPTITTAVSATEEAAGVEADYLFHKLDFNNGVKPQLRDHNSVATGKDSASLSLPQAPTPPAVRDETATRVVVARGHHLCVNDTYRTVYSFRIKDTSPTEAEVLSWSSRHVVNGPKKNQDILNNYERHTT